MNIQWYPGHMAKTRREMAESLSLCDVVCEVIDARIPRASRNPDLDELIGSKPRLIVLNRADQADQAETGRWAEHFSAMGHTAMETDGKSGHGVDRFAPAMRTAARERLERLKAKGQNPRLRAMIVGVPNVGKSTLINRITGRRVAKTEDRPGVTRGKQWFSVAKDLELLDTPGMLWPKFEDQRIGLYLAFTGAIRDDIMDIETLGLELVKLLRGRYPATLKERYQVDPSLEALELMEAAARRRGCIVSGGEVDYGRIATILLDEFRSGRLGRMTLETVAEEGADGAASEV